MPKRLNIRDLIRIVEADGWYLVRTAGSHRQFKHPDKRGRVTIAGKPSDTLPIKTQRSIFQQAGLDPKDYE